MKAILQVNTMDSGGGAEKVAMDLHRSYLTSGLDSMLLVGLKKTDLASVREIPTTRWYRFWNNVDRCIVDSGKRGSYHLHQLLKKIKAPHFEYSRKTGKENYHYPNSIRLVKKFQDNVDIVHLHNLHANYFDLRILPSLSSKKLVLITLHDEYLFTGHCAYTLGCERWRSGCGECPNLWVYPSVKMDNTRQNWSRKKQIFSQSRLTLVAPSVWLAERASQSLLGLPVRVIPNGVDLDVFKPGSQTAARDMLGLDEEAFIILYTAVGGRGNPFKDYDMLDRLIRRMQTLKFDRPVVLLAVGGSKELQLEVNDVTMIEKTYVSDPRELARYYQACDLYVHTAKADNAPLVILEAMACGKAIVATNAGGIPELVREVLTGYTVPVGDDEQMASRVLDLIQNPESMKQMGLHAAEIAKNEYGLDRMVQNYLDLYQELINEH